MNGIRIRVKKHFLPATILVCLAAVILYFLLPHKYTVKFITQVSGYISIIILGISLIIGPINLILGYKNQVSTYWRRDISIMGGLLGIAHSIIGLFVHLRGKTLQYFIAFDEHGYHLKFDNFRIANHTGLIATIILVVLLVTSNDYSLKRLGGFR